MLMTDQTAPRHAVTWCVRVPGRGRVGLADALVHESGSGECAGSYLITQQRLQTTWMKWSTSQESIPV
jgi:hypothetical protein